MNNELFQIHLNSKFADRSFSTSDCEWYLPLIEIPLQHTIYISVQHAIIPYSFYNINTSNNYLNYYFNGNSYPIYIPVGNYSAFQLLSFLKSNINFMDVSYDVITNKFTFTNSTYDFAFLSSSTCFELIGFLVGSEVNSFNRIITSVNSINLQSKHCICIQSNFQTGSINTTNRHEGNVICSIPIADQPFSMISYQNHNNLKYNMFNNTISSIHLKLTDQNNNLVNLNGCHWSISIQLEIVRFAV